ncbi:MULTISPECIES: 3-mercaptopyruvate sulfurtransferase [Stappiaceae]|uniref:3-mercaptopyruvate sulfurtransferase n=1 Tax=Roseibium album TaxID=311410 RepID=A0A0M7B1I9_9HYPH|nr:MULTISPECIES: 3-mercaptopyruvate sulfurtransferase [Stappiaceae]CTQ62964.1 3-mercaptopyruvate sulfurtransferase [Roseibium album]CTQ79149.1 3-mercaptopyruvate sulfurtransferase [Roseibium album]CTQ80552.1 3-mercaptopyruvate sulfurtransferase [Roseibium album]
MSDHPLVSTQWLADHLESPDLAVINAWMPPVTHPDAPPVYPNAHVPGAVFFDVNEICDKTSDLPHMLPQPHVFSSAMRKLGIGDGQTIVVYDDFGFYSAPRVWWTLRTMGAERVFVLDGGFPKWRAENRPVTDDVPRKPQSHFTSRLNHGAVADLAEIRNTIRASSRQILDARSVDRFSGVAPEPRAGLRSGHMPSALNLPFTRLINESGTFRTKDELKQIYQEAGVDLEKPVTTTCGSGVTAAILTLGLTVLGSRDLALYDGSWTDWGGREDTEIVSDPS